jgi:hypothetical protein
LKQNLAQVIIGVCYSSDVGTTKGRPVRFGPLVGIYEWHVVKISLICTFNHNQQNCFDFSHFHLKIIIKMIVEYSDYFFSIIVFYQSSLKQMGQMKPKQLINF